MLAWLIVLVLLIIALGLNGGAGMVESTAQRRALTLSAVATAAAAVAYAVYRESTWMMALSILVATGTVMTMHTRPIAAEALAAQIHAHLPDGRVLHLTVAQRGMLLIFRGRPCLRMSARRYRLLDQCPHCFLERQVSALFDDTVAERVIEHYRAKLADNRPVELQLTRSSAPPAEAPVAHGPGEPWVLNYYYPSNRTWQVAFPVACDVHHPTALHRRPGTPGTSG